MSTLEQQYMSETLQSNRIQNARSIAKVQSHGQPSASSSSSSFILPSIPSNHDVSSTLEQDTSSRKAVSAITTGNVSVEQNSSTGNVKSISGEQNSSTGNVKSISGEQSSSTGTVKRRHKSNRSRLKLLHSPKWFV